MIDTDFELETGLRLNNMSIGRPSVVDSAYSMQNGFEDALVGCVVIETEDYVPFDELDVMGNTHLMLAVHLSYRKLVAFGN